MQVEQVGAQPDRQRGDAADQGRRDLAVIQVVDLETVLLEVAAAGVALQAADRQLHVARIVRRRPLGQQPRAAAGMAALQRQLVDDVEDGDVWVGVLHRRCGLARAAGVGVRLTPARPPLSARCPRPRAPGVRG